MDNLKVTVSFFGLSEADVTTIDSLLSILNGRQKISWDSVGANQTNADVMVVYGDATGSGKIVANRRQIPLVRTILVRPYGSFPLPKNPAVVEARHPLRHNEILDIFERLEDEFIKRAASSSLNPASEVSTLTDAISNTVIGELREKGFLNTQSALESLSEHFRVPPPPKAPAKAPPRSVPPPPPPPSRPAPRPAPPSHTAPAPRPTPTPRPAVAPTPRPVPPIAPAVATKPQPPRSVPPRPITSAAQEAQSLVNEPMRIQSVPRTPPPPPKHHIPAAPPPSRPTSQHTTHDSVPMYGYGADVDYIDESIGYADAHIDYDAVDTGFSEIDYTLSGSKKTPSPTFGNTDAPAAHAPQQRHHAAPPQMPTEAPRSQPPSQSRTQTPPSRPMESHRSRPTQGHSGFVSAFQETDLSKSPMTAPSLSWIEDEPLTEATEPIEWISPTETQTEAPETVIPLDVPSLYNEDESIPWTPSGHPVSRQTGREKGAAVVSSLAESSRTPNKHKHALPPIPTIVDDQSELEDGEPSVELTSPHGAPTIAEVVLAIQRIRQPNADYRYLDVFSDQLGWIGRVNSDKSKVFASTRFMLLPRQGDDKSGDFFTLMLQKRNTQPTIAAGDAIIIVDREAFLWQIAYQFCRSLVRLGFPLLGTMSLRRWPDFGALPEISARPGVMLATSLLSRQPITLKDLLTESAASEVDIARLVGMCWMRGWIAIETMMPDTVAEGDDDDMEIPDTNGETTASRKRKIAQNSGNFGTVVRGLRSFLGINPPRGHARPTKKK
jgi:hypothetical protein